MFTPEHGYPDTDFDLVNSFDLFNKWFQNTAIQTDPPPSTHFNTFASPSAIFDAYEEKNKLMADQKKKMQDKDPKKDDAANIEVHVSW